MNVRVEDKPNVPTMIAVVGGGQMGSGIAHAFLVSGFVVTVVEGTPELVDAARARVVRLVQASHDRGVLPAPVDEVLGRARFAETMTGVAGANLVIEAVPEDLQLKSDVLARAEAAADSNAVLATNTSSISIDELSAQLARPDAFLGLHFFNPVPASKLIEIVKGSRTSETTIGYAQTLVAAIAKSPIVVSDSPGFASSRLGVALGLEAIRMVEEGVATPEDIDAAMTLGYKHPVGPLRLTDLVGLDVRLGIATYLAARLGPRFEPPRLMHEMVDDGKLGKKSGRGFYEW